VRAPEQTNPAPAPIALFEGRIVGGAWSVADSLLGKLTIESCRSHRIYLFPLSELVTAFRIQERELLSDAELRHAQEIEYLRSRLQQNDPEVFIKLARAYVSGGGSDYLLALTTLRDGLTRCVPAQKLFRTAVQMLEKGNCTQEAASIARHAETLFRQDRFFGLAGPLMLPVVYDRFDEIESWRTRFSLALHDLLSKLTLDTQVDCRAMLAAMSRHTNFYLTYQGRNDRLLQQQYGALVHRVMAANYPDWVKPRSMPAVPQDGRIRVGYLSARFRKNTVLGLHAGWLTQLDRRKVELFTYYIGKETDTLTDEIRLASDHFRHAQDLEDICGAVLADDLHIAVFIDIGMDGIMTLLAGLRLAPIQCQTWAHPITSGSPAMDYFLSSDLMEPASADRHYNERLIRLPGIASYYEKPLPPRLLLYKDRTRYGLGEARTVYLCCQSTFKYLPQHDHILVDIAQRNPSAQFAFIATNDAVGADLWRRLEQAFALRGLGAADYCVMLPPYRAFDYWNLYLISDVFLDTLDYSGFLTTMDAVACPIPVVTLPGEFNRGRHSYAILTQLGVTDTIARDKNEYVDLAVRVGKDRVWRAEIIRRMREGHPALFQDERSVRALEDFYQRAVAEALGLQEASPDCR
jgi:protein O-GlcNAc transferase